MLPSGPHGIIVTINGNRFSDPNSNPRQYVSVFHFALMSLGKAWILFPFQQWVKIGQTGFFSFGMPTSLREGKLDFWR